MMWQKTILVSRKLPYKYFVSGLRRQQRALKHNAAAAAISYLHNPGVEPLTYQTAGAVLAEAAHRYPGRVAVRSPHEDLEYTYEELLVRADALGCALRGRGMDYGARVGIWSHNSMAWLVALVAALRVGLIPVAINPVYENPELEFCLKKTRVKGLLIGNRIPTRDYYTQLTKLVPELPGSKPGELNSGRFPDLRTVIVGSGEELPDVTNCNSLIAEYERQGQSQVSKYSAEVSPDHGSIIHFTSGTTGDPKAALDSHFGLVNQMNFVGKRNTLHEDHHTVCVQVPIFHALGSVITVLSSLRHGSTLVLAAPAYNVAANGKALIADKCSVVIGTPTMFVDLVVWMRSNGVKPENLRVALTAGAPCSPQLFKNILQDLGAQCVKSLYGMTETTASVFMSMTDETMEQVTQTVGYLQDHVEVKVVDDNENVVPMGSPGQLLVRGYNTMLQYWAEPEKTRQALSADGWLRTGDNFTLSADGYGRIVGRQKDIIVRGGENIAPKEIEDLLNTHPLILDSQVIGVSDERLGEEICAVLILQGNASSVTAEELQKFCSGKLARFKIPRIVRVVEEFPKTASGKIQKYKLRALVEKGSL